MSASAAVGVMKMSSTTENSIFIRASRVSLELTKLVIGLVSMEKMARGM